MTEVAAGVGSGVEGVFLSEDGEVPTGAELGEDGFGALLGGSDDDADVDWLIGALGVGEGGDECEDKERGAGDE